MGIKKTITDANFGIPMGYHAVSFINVQRNQSLTIATVDSYFDEAAYGNKLRSLTQNQIYVPGDIPRDVDLIDWLEAQLVANVADDSPGLLNRTLLSGGEVISERPVVVTEPVAADPVASDPADTAEKAPTEAEPGDPKAAE